MNIYKTNSALGYNQYAILIKVNENEYLVIDTIGICDCYSSYKIGSCVTFEFEQEVEIDSNYKLENSSLYNSFLFNHFLKHKILNK